MTLRLAFDLDGVFADLGAHLRDVTDDTNPAAALPEGGATVAQPVGGESAGSSTGPAVIESPFDTPHLRGGSRQVWTRLSAIENFWETLNEIEEGSVRRLAALTRERRWEVIFLTSRPDAVGDSVQLQSQRWLEDKGFRLPSVFVTRGSRGKIAAALALDLVVDDNPENCLDIATESEARAILLWRGTTEVVPASARRLGIGSVTTVSECLSVLDEADRDRRGGGGFLDACRRLLGLNGVPAAGDR